MHVSVTGGSEVKTGQLRCQTQGRLKGWDGGVGGVGMDMCVYGVGGGGGQLHKLIAGLC